MPEAYHYKMIGGPLDGLCHIMTLNVDTISCPVFEDGRKENVDEEVAKLNFAHHGHIYNPDTKFFVYMWNGHIDDSGFRHMMPKGYSNSPVWDDK